MSAPGIVMMLAAASNRTLKTFSYPVGSTSGWTCPATTYRIETLVVKGSDGTPNYAQSNSAVVMNTDYSGSGSGSTGGVYTWDALEAYISEALGRFNAAPAPGTSAYRHQNLAQYASSYTLTYTDIGVPADIIAGTAVILRGAPTSGPVASGGYASVDYQQLIQGTNGAASTGFGLTSSGGVRGASAAVNGGGIAVVPGTIYNATVASGSGSQVTITYYE